jgi:carboxylate-amine ligase
LAQLEPVADRLGCLDDLDGINRIIASGASYQRQRAVAEQHHGELDAVVASLVAEMRAGHAL